MDRLIDIGMAFADGGFVMVYASAFFGGDGLGRLGVGGGMSCDGIGCNGIGCDEKSFWWMVSWYASRIRRLFSSSSSSSSSSALFLYQLCSPVYFFERYKFFTHGPYLPTLSVSFPIFIFFPEAQPAPPYKNPATRKSESLEEEASITHPFWWFCSYSTPQLYS